MQAVEDAKTSKRILDLAREQQEEIAMEFGEGDDEEWDDEDNVASCVFACKATLTVLITQLFTAERTGSDVGRRGWGAR